MCTHLAGQHYSQVDLAWPIAKASAIIIIVAAAVLIAASIVIVVRAHAFLLCIHLIRIVVGILILIAI
jgi:hypothetical protein